MFQYNYKTSRFKDSPQIAHKKAVPKLTVKCNTQSKNVEVVQNSAPVPSSIKMKRVVKNIELGSVSSKKKLHNHKSPILFMKKQVCKNQPPPKTLKESPDKLDEEFAQLDQELHTECISDDYTKLSIKNSFAKRYSFITAPLTKSFF